MFGKENVPFNVLIASVLVSGFSTKVYGNAGKGNMYETVNFIKSANGFFWESLGTKIKLL